MSLAAIRAAAAKVRDADMPHGDGCSCLYGKGKPCDCVAADIARLLDAIEAIDAAETNADPLGSICAAHARTSAFLAGEKPEAGKEGASE